jgi:hypothetical protein
MASTTTLVCGKCGKISKALGNPRKCTECGQDSVRIYAKRAVGQLDQHAPDMSQVTGREIYTPGIQAEAVGVSG